MNSDYAVRCETRGELLAYGVGILFWGSVVLAFVIGADELPFEVVALLCAGYVALLAWAAIRAREWLVLGDAMLLFSPVRPRVGQRFTCRMQFERPPAAQGTARAVLICQRVTRSRTVDRKTGETKETSQHTELWRDTQTALTPGLIEFTFDPPQNPTYTILSKESLRWELKVRGQGTGRFRRTFHVPLGLAMSGARDRAHETFEARFAALTPTPVPGRDRAIKVIYGLCAVMFLSIAGVTAWGLADHFQFGQPGAPQLEGGLRLGDLRQSSTSDFAARLDGRFAWQRGSLRVQADSLRLRAWDCEGACPRIKEVHLSLWHHREDEAGAGTGIGVARSDPMRIDELPQDGVVLDLGSRTFALRFRGDHDPRQLALMLEVKTEKTTHQYGQRFGGASYLLGLDQSPGEAETCAKVKSVLAALEHFCHGRIAELLSEVESPAERQRLLFLAVRRGNIEAVKVLVAAEVPVDPANRRGYTPLMESAFADLPQIAAVLLEAGANPNFVANASSQYGGETPLGAALTAGALRCVQVLLDKGADPKATHGESPLIHVAVAADLPEAVAWLVKKGADANTRAEWGNQPTPLMAAAGTGKLQIVDKLLELGADPAAADSNGNTARDYAATHKRREVLARLKSFPGQCPLTGC